MQNIRSKLNVQPRVSTSSFQDRIAALQRNVSGETDTTTKCTPAPSEVPSSPPFPKPSHTTSINPTPPPSPQNHPSTVHSVDLQSSINSTTYKSPTMQKPECVGTSLTRGPSGKHHPPVPQRENTDPSRPKKKPIPPVFVLGDIPLKPPRPPNVDIGKLKKNETLLNEGYPAHKPKADIKNEGGSKNVLESWTYQQNLHTKTEDGIVPNLQEEIIDEDLYEELEELWVQHQDVKESSHTKEVKMEDGTSTKDIKKQLEEDKQLQKAKEKREQQARKKFKIKGEIQIIKKGMARLDCKGGKMDLPLKQGETIEIVHIVDNPGRCWLGRNTEGYYGYVKTESINVGTEPEVYDDVGTSGGVCGVVKGHNVMDGEIYDDVLPLDDNKSFPLPAAVGDEVYDDIESQGFPPQPNVLDLTPKVVLDPKKKKKFEKEEKEFRKKFKFEGEIQVHGVVTIATPLATKNWGKKDLHLKPGELIDVIVKPVDGRLIGRNSEGKFGNVALANVSQGEAEIYDDIGEECIYDND